jgi:hypothetical protein
MDDFAQSREPDDLFSDEIEPTEQKVTQGKGKAATAPTLAPPKSHPQRHGASNTNQNHRGGRRGGQNGGTTTGRVDQPIPTASSPTAPTDTTATTNTNPPPSKPAAAAAAADENRITSVRGDRSATGPAKPTKKTEAELTELMKSMQLKNAAKTEAHARAEKDQASFLQREQQAAAKRVEERKAIREQDMERAKNRERKIKAQGGREWDSEKVETDIVDRSRGGSSMYSRGAHGGVRESGRGGERGGLASSRYGASEDAEEVPFGGGRGGRGRGRGRGRAEYDGARGGGRGGRGRGGYFNGAKSAETPPLGGEADFPALPTPASKPTSTPASKVETKEKPAVAPGVVDGDWADEMATPVEKT